jgi:hypothetical protein
VVNWAWSHDEEPEVRYLRSIGVRKAVAGFGIEADRSDKTSRRDVRRDKEWSDKGQVKRRGRMLGDYLRHPMAVWYSLGSCTG